MKTFRDLFSFQTDTFKFDLKRNRRLAQPKYINIHTLPNERFSYGPGPDHFETRVIIENLIRPYVHKNRIKCAKHYLT